MADNQNNQPGTRRKFNPVGLVMGIGVGVALGVALDNLAIWIPIGVVMGIAFSRAMGKR